MKTPRDKFTYNFWMKNTITENDISRFLTQKILWNMKKLKMSRPEIDRLIAFQQACSDSGKTDVFKRVENLLVQELQNRAG